MLSHVRSLFLILLPLIPVAVTTPARKTTAELVNGSMAMVKWGEDRFLCEACRLDCLPVNMRHDSLRSGVRYPKYQNPIILSMFFPAQDYSFILNDLG